RFMNCCHKIGRRSFKRGVKIFQSCIDTQLFKAGHSKCADPTRDDTTKVAETATNDHRKTMHSHPFANADTDSPNFRFRSCWRIAPDTDSSFYGPAFHTKFIERPDDPVFQRMNKISHICLPLLQVKHDVTDPLSRSMIGVTTTTASLVNGKLLAKQL